MEIRKLQVSESNSLFDAYINDFGKVKDFYQFNYQGNWETIIKKRGDHQSERKKIARIMERQNKGWNAPQQVHENISKLDSQNSLVLITGQQAGVFGGPLYTICKIITTLKLANWLSTQYSDYNFIPCFWMEVDDHDFKEINHIHFFNKNNELRRLELTQESVDELKPIHSRQLHSEISGWKAIIEDEFHATEFMDDILKTFFEAYSEQRSYPDAFARLILKFFGKYGLVVFDPTDPEMKKLGRPLFSKVIGAPFKIQEQLKEKNQSLAELNLPEQIQFQPNQTLLFYTDDKDQRVRIDVDENGDFLLKYNNGYEKLAKSKLMNIIEETPERLSANVALRPLFQDYVLPTVGYIAGPAEVAYFAQIGALYNYFDLNMPVIYPRHRITIIESKIQRLIEKLEIDIADLFHRRSDYLEFFIQQKQNENTFNEIEAVKAEITQKLNQLEKIVEEVDPTLVNAIQKTEQKTRSNIEQVINKITNSLKQNVATEMNQLKRTLLFLFPEDTYQERVINIIYFLIKYGPDFIHNLYEELPVDTKRHHLIYL